MMKSTVTVTGSKEVDVIKSLMTKELNELVLCQSFHIAWGEGNHTLLRCVPGSGPGLTFIWLS